jgi:Rho-binding antiterminator
MRRPYRPIECSLHDRLESFATLRGECSIVFRKEDGTEWVMVDRIVDVFARDGEEWLTTSSGEQIRLDRITTVEARMSESA